MCYSSHVVFSQAHHRNQHFPDPDSGGCNSGLVWDFHLTWCISCRIGIRRELGLYMLQVAASELALTNEIFRVGESQMEDDKYSASSHVKDFNMICVFSCNNACRRYLRIFSEETPFSKDLWPSV